MTTEGGWKPTLSLDRESRRTKAEKITALIEAQHPFEGAQVLEIGTGGGIIASLLAEQAGDQGEVWSVDIEDMRVVDDGYNFKLVDGVELPFGEGEFDIVVSNHTIEHVGDTTSQAEHLHEIHRVLRGDGIVYLATPSRWALIEPHFKVPFLSWFPASARDRVLKLTRRGSIYDINPLTRPRLAALAKETGFDIEDITVEALKVTATVEHGRMAGLSTRLPKPALRLVRRTTPTMVFLLRPKAGR